MAVRKNISISEETAKWYKDKAKEIGTTQSALMSIALVEYIKQDNALKTMSNIMIEMKRLQEVKDELPQA
jgi:plasmid rolling circle replication initiator protein Rep